MAGSSLSRVGAPVIERHSPLEGTPPARFQRWIEFRRGRVEEMLESLTLRWELLASFVEVNFLHPEVGPAGALFLVSSSLDGRAMRRRRQRLMVIPHREVAPYVPRWERGETVVVSVAEMPDELARRYDTTPIRWSLNAPVRMGGEWVGLVGAVTDERGFCPRTVAGFEAMAEVLMLEFAADSAWCRFRSLTSPGNRFLQLLR